MAVQRGLPRIGLPVLDTLVIATECAVAPCGCSVFCGRRTDNDEAATVTATCGDDHQPMVESFNAALLATLPTDSKEPLVETCDRVLEETYALWTTSGEAS